MTSLRVGITGGIGVGKSVCSRIFATLGIPVYDADSRAKVLMVKSEKVKSQIISAFGKESYLDNGDLNRAHLAGIVFSNPEKTKEINKIVHPAVAQDTLQWFMNIKGYYGLYEAALMYESGSTAYLDFIIVVDAPEELRIKRVKDRDGVRKEEVLKRMSKQMPQSEKVDKADHVIINDGSTSLIKQILEIHELLVEKHFDGLKKP